MTPAGARPRGVQLTADGKRLYVALSDLAHIAKGPADAVVALDARTFKEIQRFDVGTDPERFVVTRDGSRLYSANEDAGTATVTDIRKNKVIASLVVGIEPEGVGPEPGRALGLRHRRDQQHRLGDRHPHARGGHHLPRRSAPAGRRLLAGRQAGLRHRRGRRHGGGGRRRPSPGAAHDQAAAALEAGRRRRLARTAGGSTSPTATPTRSR